MEVFNQIAKQQQQQQQVTSSVQSGQPKVSQMEQIQHQQMQQDRKAEANEVNKIQNESDAENLVKQMNKALDPFNTALRFGFDNMSEDFYVSVIDTSTSKIIRRFPAEEAVTLAEKMNDVTGMLFDQKG
jgi:flagellar protein FlaG